MKVALINPRGYIFGRNDKLRMILEKNKAMESFKTLWSGPNLGLITLASLFPDEWSCEYFDMNYDDVMPTNKDFDIVFISAMTQQINNAYQIAREFKEEGILTVIGGIHATVLPEEVSNMCDVVLSGEAEMVWADFYHDLEADSLKRIYTPPKDKVYYFENYNVPRYDLLKKYNYPIITIQTTRGCPHNCSFCAASKVFGNVYRRKKNIDIYNEFKHVKKMYPDRLILFADDNAFVYQSESISLLEMLKELNIRFIAQVDISIAQNEMLLEAMVKAGCQWVVIGFESVNMDSLIELDNAKWKYKQSKTYKDSIRKINSYGIGVYGTFIVGLDKDTNEIFKSTAEFIINNKLYGANITIPTPLPGTRLRDEMISENRVLDLDWDFYTLWDVVITFPQFDKEIIEDGLLYIYNMMNDETHINQRVVHLKYLAKRRKFFVSEMLV